MANNVGTFVTPGTVGPLAFGPDPGDTLYIALLAQRGRANVPTLVTSFDRFKALFGGPVTRSAGTAYSAGYEVLRHFFRRGGKRAVVLRIEGTAVEALTTLVDRATEPVAILNVYAKGSGTWANNYDLIISAGTQADTFKLTILDENGDEVEPWDNLLPTDSACEAVSDGSSYVRLVRNPANVTASPDNLPALGTFALGVTTPGTNDNDPTAAEIVGTVVASVRTGLKALRTYRYGRGAICAPDLDNDPTVIAELVAQSLPFFRVHVTSSQAGATVATAITQRLAVNNKGSVFLYPRIRDLDAYTSQAKTYPAVGHMIATWWAEIALKGQGKAPAGAAFTIDAVPGIERAANGSPLIEAADAELLVGNNVNPIWDRTGLGNAIWGGRAATNEVAWKMASCAYLYCVIGDAVQRVLDQQVYEVVGSEEFDAMYMGVYGFLAGMQRAGAFRGNLPDPYSVPDEVNDAFAVFVGAGIQTPTDNANNVIRVRIWFREALTAETIEVELAKQTAT